ncbi:MAG: glycosyltransferase family 4 protein [Gemmatimonadales bacterium]|nr:glycosyltransferase family 4 protein [Gemmatimonadales bacterium]
MTAPLKVLYIDGVGPFGGSSRSLYETMNAFPVGSVERYFVVQRGSANEFYSRLAEGLIGVRGLTRFDNTRVSHYRGARWLVLLRELLYLPSTVAGLVQARRRWRDIDLIHVNEITEIIPGLIAKALFRAPMILHTRSIQRRDPGSLRTRWIHRRLRRSVAAVVAIDEGVRASLPADAPVYVIHNSFAASPTGTRDDAYLAQLDVLRPSSLKVGFVGNLHRTKGFLEMLEAARLVKASGGDVQYLIVGGSTAHSRGVLGWVLEGLGLAQNMQADPGELIREYGLQNDFLLLGATKDIQRVYPHMDVLAFPSYFDAPGRPVFEAAFFGVPSIVAVSNPRKDTVIDGETAIAIRDPEPQQIADAILRLERDRSEVRRMGKNARALAQRNFVPEVNSALLLALYRKVVGEPEPTHEPRA